MAIIIRNKTICEICKKPLKVGEEIVGFPHFCGDPKSPLYFFTDAGFHESCFLQHPLKDQVLKAIAEYDEEVEKLRRNYSKDHP